VHGLKPQQLAQIFILYPNPEPKNPAQRWLNMPFFEFLLSRLQDGGRITLASNIPDYIAEAALQCQNVWQLPFVQETIPHILTAPILKSSIWNAASPAHNSSSPSHKAMSPVLMPLIKRFKPKKAACKLLQAAYLSHA
jgi:tRNA G46 methylase TrmB